MSFYHTWYHFPGTSANTEHVLLDRTLPVVRLGGRAELVQISVTSCRRLGGGACGRQRGERHGGQLGHKWQEGLPCWEQVQVLSHICGSSTWLPILPFVVLTRLRSWQVMTHGSFKILLAYLDFNGLIFHGYLMYISDTSPAYLRHISWVFQAYVRHISWVSQSYLIGISGISQAYLRHISGISDSSQAYLMGISGICQAYLMSISVVSYWYLGHISGISQAYLWSISVI